MKECTHPAMENGAVWKDLFVHGSYSTIVLKALPLVETDSEAARWFLRIFTVFTNLFMLDDEAVAALSEYAERGNRFALFGYGRYQMCVKPDPDSMDKAKSAMLKADSLGLPEATASLGQMYFYGDFGLVDREKAVSYIGASLAKGCDYAAELHLKNVIFGLHGFNADPQKALDMVLSLIANDILNIGAGNENPMWHYLKGCALQQLRGLQAAKDSYIKAASMGVVSAWTDVAVSSSHNDDGELVDADKYAKMLDEGIKRGDVFCLYLTAVSRMEEYERMDGMQKKVESEKLLASLESACSKGSSFAAETLGDIYWFGDYGVPEDNEKAWQWYAKGALMYSPECYEKMWGMVHDHYIDKDEAFKDMLALQGARAGSKKLLGETVMAYTYGRLTEFAAEIERYYEPVFDAEDADSTDGEVPDDDGRFDAYV